VWLPGDRRSPTATKNAGVGAIFEAVVWEGGRISSEVKENLLDRLWECSEEVIREAGGQVSTTTHTDPAWTTEDYKALMDRLGYRLETIEGYHGQAERYIKTVGGRTGGGRTGLHQTKGERDHT